MQELAFSLFELGKYALFEEVMSKSDRFEQRRSLFC